MGSRENEWLVVLGGGRTQMPFVQAARDLGLSTLVIDRDPGAPAASIAQRFHAISLHAAPEVEAIVSGLETHTRGALAYTADPRVLALAGRINRRLGCAWFQPDERVLTADKARIQRALTQGGIHTPAHEVVRNVQELSAFLDRHSQAVLKPEVGGRGSAGVVRLSVGDDLPSALNRALASSDSHQALVEAFIEAPEYTLDGLVVDGVCHVLHCARKHHLDGGVIMRGFSSEHARLTALETLACEATQALAMDDSFFSFDVLDAPAGPCVIDAGVLMDAKVEKLLAFSGVDIYTLTVQLMAGERPALPRTKPRGHALRFLYAPAAGTLERLDHDGAHWERNTGEAVQPPTSVADIVGWLMASADTAEDAWRAVCAVADEELFRVTP